MQIPSTKILDCTANLSKQYFFFIIFSNGTLFGETVEIKHTGEKLKKKATKELSTGKILHALTSQ